MRCFVLPPAAALCLLPFAVHAEQPDDVVRVVGQTPLGTAVDIDRIPANVQAAESELIRQQNSRDLAEFMHRNLGSVHINEAQSNPLQPDLQYRGFVGSPLLGLPQGLAVYQDGVRLNEPFGDTVSWALLPRSAVAEIQLIPGSNPLFGLNALGGAVSIRTQDGFSRQGTVGSVYGGSFGRVALDVSTGGATDDFAYFAAAERLEEDGWRDASPTEATQLFGKLGWSRAATDIDLSVALAETDLVGNGAAPVQLLARDRAAIFTHPDRTRNELGMINLVLDHAAAATWFVKGNVYRRASDIATYNGDDSDFDACSDTPGLICSADDDDEEPLLDANGNGIAVSDSLLGATINRSDTRQDTYGFAVQGSRNADWRGRENLFVAGLAWDDNSVDFTADTELGSLDASRRAIPGGVYVPESFTRLAVASTSLGLYFSNAFTLSETVALTLSGRYNSTRIILSDRIGTALNGNHGFERFNPALGLTVSLAAGMTFYAGYGESARAPSPVELTCADADDPCRLPNAFLSDPPLDQVVARTLEMGMRGETAALRWHAGAFQTVSEDDILFISAGALTNQGYFDNIGRTRRDGLELNLHGDSTHAAWFLNYSFLRASFRDPVALPSPNNPAAIDGEVLVLPGDRLPLLPEHAVSAGAQFSPRARLRFGFGVNLASGYAVRGDEGNDLDAIDGHAVVNVRGEFRLNDQLRLFANIDNLFNREYESFGLFGEADEVLGDAFDDPRFLSPGAPRAAWFGVRFEL